LALGLLVGFFTLELLPRRRSLQKLDKRFLRMIPVVRIAYGASKLYLRMQRRISSKPGEELSDDVKEEIVERAIESLADQVGAGEKLVEEDERQMIENIFHLDNTFAKEIMTPRVDLVALPLNIKLTELREIANNHGHSRYPVYQESVDKIVGALLIKDIFTHPPSDPEKFSVTDYMKEPFFVPEEMPIDDLLTTFKSRRIHMAVVVDEHGGTAGIVSLEDVLEEIVGEIEDEHDDETAEFIERGSGVYETSGAFSMEDLAERLGLEYEQKEFETVAGLLYDLVGSVPNEGQEIRWGRVTFIPIQLDGQRIDRILIRLNPLS
jgi:CBS domain containing-hemolysin-like protein